MLQKKVQKVKGLNFMSTGGDRWEDTPLSQTSETSQDNKAT